MMKPFLCIMLLAPVISIAQKHMNEVPLDPETNTYRHEGVADVPGVDASTLFARSKKWLVTKFPDSPLHVDSVAKRIVGKGSYVKGYETLITMPVYHVMEYTIVLDFKDEKYRYQFQDFVDISNDANGGRKQVPLNPTKRGERRPFTKIVYRGVDEHIQTIIPELYQSVSTKTVEDW